LFEMKIHATADDVALWDAMSDEDLVKTVRDSLAAFKAGRAADDLEPGTPSKGGRSTATIETPASRSANDAARATHRAAARNTNLTAADRAAHRLAAGLAGDFAAEEQRTKTMARIIPGYDRLP
jgi:hypothetical protein